MPKHILRLATHDGLRTKDQTDPNHQKASRRLSIVCQKYSFYNVV